MRHADSRRDEDEASNGQDGRMTRDAHSIVVSVFKWCGVAACVVILCIWIVCIVWGIQYYMVLNGQGTLITCVEGTVQYTEVPISTPPYKGGKNYRVVYMWSPSRTEALHRRFGFVMPGVRNKPLYIFRMPLWILLLSVVTPTFMLFLYERKARREGHCQSCNYNLTGNVSGICPECGTKISAD